jgi:glutamate decarboxylase
MHMAEAGKRHVHTNGGTSHITPYSTRYASRSDIPKFQIPQQGAPADAVYQILKDELDLDGKPNLNLARYVITLINPAADKY